jgi:hypothetical protein
MALTTLSVHLLPPTDARRPSVIRIFLFGLLLFTGSLLSGCGSGEESGDLARYALQDGAGSGCDDLAHYALQDGQCPRPGSDSANPTGSASASLAWDPVGGVLGYIIHYGTQSPGSPGSCAYAHSMFSTTPSAMVKGLAGNTTYYFAVSSYNGLESACSGEVMKVTQSA